LGAAMLSLCALTVASWAVIVCLPTAKFDPHLAHLFWAPAFAAPAALLLPQASIDALGSRWRSLVATQPPAAFLLAILASLLFLWVIVGGGLLVADLIEGPAVLQRARAQPNAKRDWRTMLPRLALKSGGNFLGGGVFAALATWLLRERISLPPFLLLPELPSAATFSREVALHMLTYEACFYYSHRLLHTKWFYARVHKIHHEWKAPTALAATHAHPIEYVLSNVSPGLVGLLLWRPHFLSFYFFTVQGVFATLWAHSGYELTPGASAHDRHHKFFTGNFGHLGILDWLHGTEVGPTAKPVNPYGKAA